MDANVRVLVWPSWSRRTYQNCWWFLEDKYVAPELPSSNHSISTYIRWSSNDVDIRSFLYFYIDILYTFEIVEMPPIKLTTCSPSIFLERHHQFWLNSRNGNWLLVCSVSTTCRSWTSSPWCVERYFSILLVFSPPPNSWDLCHFTDIITSTVVIFIIPLWSVSSLSPWLLVEVPSIVFAVVSLFHSTARKTYWLRSRKRLHL